MDFETVNTVMNRNSLREMPLEVMILKQKIESLGMKLEFLEKECLICIYDARGVQNKHFFKWYRETADYDLSEYFEEIYQSVRSLVSY